MRSQSAPSVYFLRDGEFIKIGYSADPHLRVLGLQPCGRSAALELGWGIGAGKRTCVLMVDGQEPELMIRLADKLALSVEEVLTWLKETK